MSEQSMARAFPTYVTTQAEAQAATAANCKRVVVWRNSFGSTPLPEQYTKEYEDPPFNPNQPFSFADHPFWG